MLIWLKRYLKKQPKIINLQKNPFFLKKKEEEEKLKLFFINNCSSYFCSFNVIAYNTEKKYQTCLSKAS